MIVIVNSKETEVPADATVQSLVQALKLAEQRVAVEVNQELVTRRAWQEYTLKAGDRVEIVSFVGGG